MEKNSRISLFVLIVILGFTFSVFYYYFQGVYYKDPYPSNTFLFNPTDRFMDFVNPLRGSADLDPFLPGKVKYKGGYLPFGYLVAYLFSLFPSEQIAWLFFVEIFIVTFFILNLYYLFGNVKKVSSVELTWTFVISCITYPVLFALDRSNYDLLITLFLGLFLLFFVKKKYLLSALILSVATAIKPFSGLYFVLFLFEKRFRDAFLGILNIAILNLISLLIFKGSLFDQVQKYIIEMIQVKELISAGSILKFSSDLYDAIVVISESISTTFGRSIKLVQNNLFYEGYFIFALLVLVLVVINIYRRNLPFWKRLSVISLLIVLLPMSTGDYRLMYLYLPLWIFLAKKRSDKIDKILVIFWGFLFIPKGYILLNYDQNINMILNPIIIIIMIGLLLLSKEDDSFTQKSELADGGK